MAPEIILSIVGSFLVLALSINAFFLRGIYFDLNDLKIQMAVIFSNSADKDRRLNELEEKVKTFILEIQNLREQIIKLEKE